VNRGFRLFGAGNETRTRDPDLGKVVLYQLSYSREDRARDFSGEPHDVKVKHSFERQKSQHKQDEGD
jgi:hypothetical protein